MLDPSTDPADAARYVLIERLAAFLEAEVPRLVRERGLIGKINQEPDWISGAPSRWLARHGAPPQSDRPHGSPPTPALSLTSVATNLVRTAIHNDETTLHAQLATTAGAPIPGADAFARDVEILLSAPGPFEPAPLSVAILRVEGAEISEALAARANIERGPQVLALSGMNRATCSVVVRLASGSGLVVPAVLGYTTTLTVVNDALVDVSYEPRAPYAREAWRDVRAIRAVVAAASKSGRFRLDGEDAEALASRMQRYKSIDLSLAISAGYGYHAMGRLDRLSNMAAFLYELHQLRFFDLELLLRRLDSHAVTPDEPVVPFVPLLAQGWSLMAANNVRLHPALEGIERYLTESLWSMYSASGVNRLIEALLTREVL